MEFVVSRYIDSVMLVTIVLLLSNKRPRGLKSLTRETCPTCSFAQNFINYMPIMWIIHAKLIVYLK